MTRAEFIDTVLENLGVLAAGQAVAAEDGAIVSRRMSAVFAQLEQEDIAAIPDPENIEDAEALPLAAIVAHELAAPFGNHARRARRAGRGRGRGARRAPAAAPPASGAGDAVGDALLGQPPRRQQLR